MVAALRTRGAFTLPRPAVVAAPALIFVAATLVRAAIAFTGPSHTVSPLEWAVTAALLCVPVAIGALLQWRVPASPVGTALSWVGAAPAAVFALESWGETLATDTPWPAARTVYALKLGAWVWNLAGFVALCLVFPDGLLAGRRRRRLTIAWAVTAGLFLNGALSFLEPESGDDTLPHAAVRIPVPALAVVAVTAFGGVLAVLVAAVSSLVLRYRRGGKVVREQVRWLMLGAATVPLLLAGGWIAQSLGASTQVAYLAFMAAMVTVVPAAVAVAVLRHDLFDVDRLLGSSLAWVLTSVLSAGVFAAVGYGGGRLAGAAGAPSVAAAAFLTAVLLMPLQRRLNEWVGRVVDRERYVLDATVRRFVADVRDGHAEPESVERVLRDVLRDPALRLLIKLPDGPPGQYVDLANEPASLDTDRPMIPLRTGDTEVGVIVLGRGSPRRLRQATEAALQARLPIEVTRLRMELRGALEQVSTSRARLMRAAAEERRSLERDLHDGAQQQIVAAGMRLRSVQRRMPGSSPEHRELDAVVEALESTIAELRRLAQGVRPSRLDDGLPAALGALVADAPVPVRLSVSDVEISEVLATTVYFVVAEVYANALKHARAETIAITVAEADGLLTVTICDDGVGGAERGLEDGLVSVRDRVASVGGRVVAYSPDDAGTRIEVVIPHADRGGR
jgi:signal transduction histidine kinase